MASGDWFYATRDQQMGPVSLDTLRGLVATGQVASGDLVWTDSMSSWVPAGTIPVLAQPQQGVGQSGMAPPMAPPPNQYYQQPNYQQPMQPNYQNPVQPNYPHPVQPSYPNPQQPMPGPGMQNMGMPNMGMPNPGMPMNAGVPAYYNSWAALQQPRYAGFWLRAVALVIDLIIVMIPLWIIDAVIIGGRPVIDADGNFTNEFLNVAPLINLINGVLAWLYAALMESSATQASLGKMILGLKVTDLNGRRIGFGRATGRYFAKILSAIILCIGFILAGFTEKKQALHDMMAGTLVISK